MRRPVGNDQLLDRQAWPTLPQSGADSTEDGISRVISKNNNEALEK